MVKLKRFHSQKFQESFLNYKINFRQGLTFWHKNYLSFFKALLIQYRADGLMFLICFCFFNAKNR